MGRGLYGYEKMGPDLVGKSIKFVKNPLIDFMRCSHFFQEIQKHPVPGLQKLRIDYALVILSTYNVYALHYGPIFASPRRNKLLGFLILGNSVAHGR